MLKVFVVLAFAALASVPAAASERTDAMAPVHQFVDGMNKGDMKSALAACSDEVSIIDNVPPHEWHGAGACAKWADALDADSKKNGVTDVVFTLGKPRHVNIEGDRAYAVIPAHYTYNMKGKKAHQAGMLTVALQKGTAGWRMTGWRSEISRHHQAEIALAVDQKYFTTWRLK